mmetsp:Transcript_492/g.1024  ORF Transcript_492/g.1024 Transcript_492/m.1024 type:complete len:97 (-) Transcript_492:398-688(-)
MPSATCEKKRPDSYVWQPNEERTPSLVPAEEANQTLSSTRCPRIDEPSVYETEYPHLPASHERQLRIPSGGELHVTECAVDDAVVENRMPGELACL